MRRDLLLLGEMIDATERAHELVTGLSAKDLQADRLRSESLLWNFTVLRAPGPRPRCKAHREHPAAPAASHRPGRTPAYSISAAQ
jgi:hypothetical protein